MSVAQHEPGTMKLSELKGADYNPRIMPDSEMRNLMASLRSYGFVQPIVVRKEDGLILGGHQRIEAMKRIVAEDKGPKDPSIPVMYVAGLTDDKAKLLNVALNRIHGEWDYAKLGDLFQSIQPEANGEFGVSGFNSREIDDIINLTSADAAKLPSNDIDIDAELAAEARKFDIAAPNDEDAAVVREALTAYGMTGPGNAGTALAAMARAALCHRVCEEELV